MPEYGYELSVDGHGGGCCGITHVSDFPDLGEADNREDRAAMIQALDDALAYIGLVGCVEVVLTDRQLREGWLRIVQKRGFRRVSRFVNGNSGNVCNIFHRYAPGVPPYKGRKK